VEANRVLERHELETFLTLAEELHFGRTADRLHVSVARVSQTIKAVERRVGAPLFERTSRRVALTAIGRRFEHDLRPAYDDLRAAFETAVHAARGVGGTVRVGFTGAAAGQLLIQATGLFGSRHPDCQVQIREVQLSQRLEPLRSEQVDLLLTCLPVTGTDVVAGRVLLSEPRLLAVAAGHPFAGREAVTVAEVAGETAVRAPCSIGEDDAGGPVAETFHEVLTMVGARQGVFAVGAHVARYYPRPDVTYIPIEDAPPLDWALVWRRADATARVRAFAGTTAEAAGLWPMVADG
jgi:DNA-binding transcriptional LysR family regulator